VPLTEAARAVVETDELKPKARGALRAFMDNLTRWTERKATLPHTELAEIVLDESGYTEMWQKDRSADAAGRLENLKELVRSMQEFENLQGFLEHISLVMDTDRGEGQESVNLMTLHSAKGLEFDTVFLPGWEEGLFPHQRALDEQGKAGLEEERRLAHVGITRARRRARICFATNRRIHGLWQTTVPSRFLDELPEDHVEVKEAEGGFGFGGQGSGRFGGYGASRFDEASAFGSSYSTPGWQRAQQNRGRVGFDESGQQRYGRNDYAKGGFGAADIDGFAGPAASHPMRGGARNGKHTGKRPLVIEGELIAKSTGASAFKIGDRVFHQKFGNGNVVALDGNKLTVDFDHAGQKRVIDSFVERV
jgi:DNA helicase-2/ATP-dependent DNA helicase PcrA